MTFPNTETQEYLNDIDACAEARTWVGERALQDAWNDCTRLDWLRWLVTAAAYAELRKVTAPARAEYDRVTTAAYAELHKVTTAAYAELHKFTTAAYAELHKVTAPAYAELRKVTAPARAEHDRVTAAADACTTCDELRAKFECPSP